MSNTVILRFDPNRSQVRGAMAAAMEGQNDSLPAQGIADALMAAVILGEFAGVEDEEQYFAMIRAALPNARKVADRPVK